MTTLYSSAGTDGASTGHWCRVTGAAQRGVVSCTCICGRESGQPTANSQQQYRRCKSGRVGRTTSSTEELRFSHLQAAASTPSHPEVNDVPSLPLIDEHGPFKAMGLSSAGVKPRSPCPALPCCCYGTTDRQLLGRQMQGKAGGAGQGRPGC